jgi:plastocyanin
MIRRLVRPLCAVVPLAVAAAAVMAAAATPGTTDAVVTDDGRRPVAEAVVSLTPLDRPAPAGQPGPAVIEQRDQQFDPYVLPVYVGTPVQFPNRDDIRHHVYSFSPAKTFELPLYVGTPPAPVVFDQPGVVALGCNIHDWMVAYVYVLATPYFATTGADGRARFADLPPGRYQAQVWHPRMRGAAERTTTLITVAPGEASEVAFVVALRPPRYAPKDPPQYERQQGG